MSSRSWLNFRRSESEAARHAGDTTVRGKIRTIRVARNLQLPKLRGSFASSRLALDDHQQRDCVRQHWSPSSAGRRRRSELSGNEEHAVIGRIEGHVPRGGRRLNCLDDAVFVGRVLVNHCECAVGIGGERIA